jgi:hypothetical protein
VALAGWHFYNREIPGTVISLAGATFVLMLALLGAPPTSASVPSAESNRATASPSTTGGIVVEQPSEADAIFDRAIEAVTPWYNDVEDALSKDPLSENLDNPYSEAWLLGTWWALTDWCIRAGDGSIGRCYDLAAMYVDQNFKRDPRTINTKTWYAAGAIGEPLDDAYILSAMYLRLHVPTPYVKIDRNRPGIGWECEPDCTEGWVLK